MDDDTTIGKAATPVASLAALPLKSGSRGRGFARAEAQVARGIGLTKLGATYVEVPPGKSAWPYHVHHAIDEMFVVLEGQGRYRLGDATYDVGPGDVLGAPRGGQALAHKLTNSGATTLRYLAISSVADADVCEYPDSGKFAAASEFGPDAEGFSIVARLDAECGYWDDEPDAAP